MTPLHLYWVALFIFISAASAAVPKYENEDFRCIFMCKCHVLEGKRTASCTHKNITRLPLNGFPLPRGIEVADLSFNRFHVIRAHTFGQTLGKHLEMEELRVLNISNNVLQRISTKGFYHIGNLRTLDLSHNRLTIISRKTFINLNKLEELYLQYNQIRSLPPYVFEGLNNLKILDLSYGKLTEINWWAFYMSNNPTLLNLTHNNLSTFHSNYIYTPTHFHYKIDLNNNPIRCGCPLQRIFQDNFYYGDYGSIDLVCSEPSAVKGMPFTGLLPEDFSGCAQQRQILSTFVKPVIGVVNTTTRLDCETVPGVQYKNWTILSREDQLTEMPDRFAITESDTWVNLTIVNTRRSDAGKYRCQTYERLKGNKGINTILPVTLEVDG